MLYELVLTSTYFDQTMVNRFNYSSSGDPASVLGSFALTSAFGAISSAGAYPLGTLFQRIRGVVSNATIFRTVSVRALRDYAPTDFFETPFLNPTVGVRGGEPASPINAIGFRTTRTRTDIRRATKRFGGMSEADMVNGGQIQSDLLPDVNALATALGATLTYDDNGNTISFFPVVCKRDRTVDPEDGKVSYPYYPTLTQQLANISIGFLWEPYTTVRSQVSRQYGVGQ